MMTLVLLFPLVGLSVAAPADSNMHVRDHPITGPTPALLLLDGGQDWTATHHRPPRLAENLASAPCKSDDLAVLSTATTEPKLQSIMHLAWAPGTGTKWEVAFNRTRDGCDQHDGVDSMPAAFFNRRDNLTTFWGAVGTELRPSTGPSLDELKHDCSTGSIFNATMAQTAESFANYQWMQSVTMFPNGTAFALIHNEFHAFNVTDKQDYCSATKSNASFRLGEFCNMWSTGLGVSHDFGKTFHLVAQPPLHRVFSAPFTYVKDQKVFGFGALSSMIQGHDSAWYGLVYFNSNSRTNATQPHGMCAFRTDSLGDPTRYRGWAGQRDGFTSQWLDPYAASTEAGVAAPSTCTPIKAAQRGSHPSPRRLVGMGGNNPPLFLYFTDKNQGEVAYSFSWEADFAKAVVDWSSSPVGTLDMGLSRYIVHGSLNYPTILDHSSPALGDDSFATVSNDTAFVYAVIDRNILRRRVVFLPGPAPAPALPAPAISRSCRHVRVSGAGLAGVDGIYSISNHTSDGVAMYSQSDDIHQIYRYRGVWKIAHMAHSDSVWYVQQRAQPKSHVPPSENWHATVEGYVPAPALLSCIEGVASSLKTDDTDPQQLLFPQVQQLSSGGSQLLLSPSFELLTVGVERHLCETTLSITHRCQQQRKPRCAVSRSMGRNLLRR
jgi:hypothetical protein